MGVFLVLLGRRLFNFVFFVAMVFSLSTHAANTIFLYAHGLGSNQHQARKLYTRFRLDNTENKHWLIDGPIALFDFPDATDVPDQSNAAFVNLGQQLDLERLHFAYEETLKQDPDCTIVLIGLSRGAATVLNYVSLYKPARLKGVIAESPFDSFDSLVKHIQKRLHLTWMPLSIGKSIMSFRFPILDINGVVPSKTIDWFPADVPLLFVHSREDRVVPVESSRALYHHLVTKGHEHVYYLELEHGAHGKVMWGPDAALYQEAVHGFFKRYAIADYETPVTDQTLSVYQPSAECIEQLGHKYA
jgi:hypothetical protein